MLKSYKGKVISIRKDKNYNGERIAKVDIKRDPMYFVVKKGMEVSKGDLVEITKNENSMRYESVEIVSQ